MANEIVEPILLRIARNICNTDEAISGGAISGGAKYPDHYDQHSAFESCRNCNVLEKKIIAIQNENEEREPDNQILYYIGYAKNLDTPYLRNTLPKSQQWKGKFIKLHTWFAEMTGGVTEYSLIKKFKFRDKDLNCVNGKDGNHKRKGYLYVLEGYLK